MTAQEIEEIKAAIAALEAQRPLLGDATVDTALAPLREKLAALTRAAPAADERKRLTVLFSDLAGFTARSEQMDPEDVHAIMDTYFERMSSVITRYEGTVEKYIGDAVMALFGAPKALENHEEMAVRAALGMHEALAELNEEVERRYGFRIAQRIGVNTGLVLFGSMGGRVDEDFAAVGTTVNLAARLESASPVGRVMISAETARRLHAIFEFEPPQQIKVKGKTEPMTVYVAVGERAKRGRIRGVQGLSAPMMGRDVELATLQRVLDEAVSTAQWRMGAVIGEAGIGKSRLRREFVARATQAHPEARLLIGRSYAHTQNTPYHLVADLVRDLFGVGRDARAEAAVEQLTEGLRAWDTGVSEREFRYRLASLAGVLGLSLTDDPLASLGPEQRRDRTFLSLEHVLLSVSARTPLLIIVEDLHWADGLSLSFLQRFVRAAGQKQAGDATGLLLAISRPVEDDESQAADMLERLGASPHERVVLEPLEGDEASALVHELLATAELPTRLVSLLLDRAQGNPFFLEEILRSFVEDGTLSRVSGDGAWRVTRDVADLDVPGAVQGVMAARLDRLPTEDKHVAQHAAIIGRTFWERLLAQVATRDEAADRAAIELPLSRLESRQLVVRLGESQVLEDWEWLFRYVLAQEVAYDSITKAVRRRVHAQVARSLEGLVDQRSEGSIPLIARHYERAEVADKAVEYLRRAGEQAAAHFANEDAVDYFSRGLRMLEEVDGEPGWIQAQRHALLLGREGVYALMGRRDEQAEDLVALTHLVEEMGAYGARAQVALRLAAYYEAISDFSSARMAAERATEWSEEAAQPRQELNGLVAQARALWRTGKLEEARRRLEEALSLAGEHGDRPGEATSLHHMGTVLYVLGKHRAARDQLERALAIRQELGDRPGAAISLSNLVGIYYGLGNLMRARAASEQALEIHRSVGDRRGEAHALTNLASIEMNLGHLRAAREGSRRARQLYQAIEDRGGEGLAASNLGLILNALGDHEAAHRRCQEALAIRREVGDRRGEGYTLTYLAMALEGLGRLEEAEAAYQEALELRREIGQEAAAIDDVAGLARVALERGDRDGAARRVDEVLAWIASQGVEGIEYPMRVYLTVARVLTAAGRGDEADDVVREAHALLEEKASRIHDDATRRAYLERVPPHRAIRRRFAQLS
jgi:class 3 adenylate cyclase/tetratricopeptide (TPR) repeat protein